MLLLSACLLIYLLISMKNFNFSLQDSRPWNCLFTQNNFLKRFDKNLISYLSIWSSGFGFCLYIYDHTLNSLKNSNFWNILLLFWWNYFKNGRINVFLRRTKAHTKIFFNVVRLAELADSISPMVHITLFRHELTLWIVVPKCL